MATPLSGRYASVKLSGSTVAGTAGTTINNLGHWEVAISFDTMDASVFGSVWGKDMSGMQGWTGTVEGFFDTSTVADTQIMGLLNSALNATKINDIRFYLESSAGFFFMPNYTAWGYGTTEAGAYISNVRIAHDKNGLASASYSVLGYGNLALFQGQLSASSAIVEEAS